MVIERSGTSSFWSLLYFSLRQSRADLSAEIVVGSDEQEEQLVDEGGRLTDDEDDNDDDHDQCEVVLATLDRRVAAHRRRQLPITQPTPRLDQLADHRTTAMPDDTEQQGEAETETPETKVETETKPFRPTPRPTIWLRDISGLET